MYTYDKKTNNKKIPLQQNGGTARQGGMPNSALRGMLPQGERSSSDLEQRVMARLPVPPIRPQAQIPQAEAEADRLSANVKASSPEGVKADLGRRMGADFSNVRFHTGADAAARANAMGARAFTSGADVYFGQGGFDPSVAAHELVHTAQQGMVDSSTATMATPEGGVQMMPNPVKWAWDKTGGRVIRKHHDAIDELDEAMSNGDWNSLSPEQQKAWQKKNRLAYSRYMKNKDNDTFKKKVSERRDKRYAEQVAAEEYLKNLRSQPGAPKTSMISADGVHADEAELEAPKGMAFEEGADTASGIVDDYVNGALGPAGGFMEAAESAGTNTVKGVGGALGTLTGVYNTYRAGEDLVNASINGDTMGVVDSFVSGVGSLGSTGSSMAGIADAANAAGASKWSGGLAIIGGAANVYQGSREIHKGRMKANAMNAYLAGAGERKDLSGDELLLRDSAAQGKMEATRQKIEGSGKVITGALDATAGALDAGGASAAAGAATQATSAVLKAGFAGANAIQKNRMKKKVVQQTTALTDDKIKEFMAQSGIKSFSRAKQALMKELGYTSGTRAELFADQTEKRGERMAALANDSATGEINQKARTVAEGLGTRKDDNGKYVGEELAKGMGLGKSRSEIASKAHSIRAMKASNDRAAAAAAAQQQQAPVAPATPAPATQTGAGTTNLPWWKRVFRRNATTP